MRTPDVTSRIMKAIRGKDSKAEVLFRKCLFSKGIRFRKHYKKLFGTPDLVMVAKKIAIFIDGDFWHGNSWKLRGLPSLAAQFPARTDFWVQKIQRNINRDRQVSKLLKKSGWRVMRFWESDVLKDPEQCIHQVLQVVNCSSSSSR